jgi:hypothetical protein
MTTSEDFERRYLADRSARVEQDRVAALLLQHNAQLIDHDRRIEAIEISRANDARWTKNIVYVILAIAAIIAGSGISSMVHP